MAGILSRIPRRLVWGKHPISISFLPYPHCLVASPCGERNLSGLRGHARARTNAPDTISAPPT